MSTTIQIKRSSTASGVPLSTDLAVGELAVNLADKRLFTKQSDGTIIELSTNPTDLDAATLRIDGVEITASAAELNKLDGFTGSTAELNLLDGLTATTIELNTLDGITASTAELNKLDGYTGSTAELNILDGVTATTAEINKLDGFTGSVDDLNYAKDLRATGVTTAELDVLDGITATTAELNITDGLTATTAELNTLDGITATTTELNYTDGVTSNIQTQLNSKAPTNNAAFTGTFSTINIADDSTSAYLYHNTSNEKLATTSTGVDVTGTVTADGLTVDGDGSQINIENTSATLLDINQIDLTGLVVGAGEGNERAILFGKADNAGRQSKIAYKQGSSNGQLPYLSFSTGDNASALNEAMRISSGGDVSFYEDTGTTAKMVWDASAESLGIGTSSPTYDLDILSDTAQARVQSTTGNAVFRIQSTDTGESKIYFGDDSSTAVGRIEYSHDNDSMSFAVDALERMRIDSSGNVGIGTANPITPLHIEGTGGVFPRITTSDGLGDTALRFYSGASYKGQVGWDYGTNTVGIFSASSSAEPAIAVDSSGNIGIGTASPDTKFEVNGGNINTVASFKSADADCRIAIADNTTTEWYSNSVGAVGNNLTLQSNGTERARIDSSGNLLVGTTTGDLYDDTSGQGIAFHANGRADFKRDSASCAFFNRVGNDGAIILFQKDGSTVGSIGSIAGQYLSIGTGDTGLAFDDDENHIIPWNVTTNGSTNGDVDLGDGARRFKDLYLSGGVYLGGTGSDNKLDDYEVGVFTPFLGCSTTGPTASYTIQQGSYVKVGRVVHVQGRVTVDTISGGNGTLQLYGLPFTTQSPATNTNGLLTVTRMQQFATDISSNAPIAIMTIAGGNTFGYFYTTPDTSGNHVTLTYTALSDNMSFNFSGSYETDQ